MIKINRLLFTLNALLLMSEMVRSMHEGKGHVMTLGSLVKGSALVLFGFTVGAAVMLEMKDREEQMAKAAAEAAEKAKKKEEESKG